MQDQIQRIKDRCNAVVLKAKELYGIDLSTVQVRFDLRGRCAGQAMRKAGVYIVRFNRDMLTREAFNHVHDNTVPHEYAHIICFMNPSLGRNHDSGWERVCRALGGSGSTRHQEEVVYGKGATYEYITTAGHAVRLSQQRHARIQQGGTLTYRRGLGMVNKACAFKIVGIAGQTINNSMAVHKPSTAVASPMVREFLEEVPVLPATNFRVVAVTQTAAKPSRWQGDSKAAKSREIMAFGYQNKWTYEMIITEMQKENGYDRQLARGTFKANAPRVGIPSTFC